MNLLKDDELSVADLGDEVTAFIRSQMTELRIPGVVVGIVDGTRSAIRGFGVTSIENPLLVTAETTFQIGSISKTITGTAILHEVEAGRVELDTPVRTYLPGFAVADPDVSRRLTVRHLLTHTGGFEGDLFESAGWGDDALSLLVGRLAKLRQVTPFGTLWSYSNASFYPLGRILEVVAGETFEEYITREIFHPLSIRGAGFDARDVILGRFSAGHACGGNGVELARPWAMERSSSPLGTIMMHMKDFLKYVQFHLGIREPSRTILSEDGRALMIEPGMPGAANCTPSGFSDGMGLTFMLGQIGEEKIVSHSGSANGQPAHVTMLPARQFGVAVFSNLQNPAHTLAERLVRFLLAQRYGLREPDLKERPFGDLDEAVGTYETYGERFKVRRRGHELEVDSIPLRGWLEGMQPPMPSRYGQRFVPVGNDTVAELPFSDRRVGRFIRDEDGAIRWLMINHRAALKVSR